jgi:hypothetical protein
MNVQVTQAELQEIVDLERDIAPKVKCVEELKEGVKALLIAKRPVEFGRFDVSLVWRYLRHPGWKQIVIDNLGPEFAEECRRRAPGHALCDLRVEEHAVLPLWNSGGTADASADTSLP